uniref:Rhodanese domain-containing protein n=1 Tax=Parascaris univalens TaxID=6257 RepID=A0A915BM37_PARUN
MQQLQKKTRDLKVALLGSLLTFVSFLLLISVILLIVLTSRTQTTQSPTSEALLSNNDNAYSNDEEARSGGSKSKTDAMEVSPSYLLTLLITKRRVCVLEASTDNNEKSWDDFREEHIESARILFFGNLSRNAAPVHPLQFQRYARSLGVDSDCHVILYDRGDMIWATCLAIIRSLCLAVASMNGSASKQARNNTELKVDQVRMCNESVISRPNGNRMLSVHSMMY